MRAGVNGSSTCQRLPQLSVRTVGAGRTWALPLAEGDDRDLISGVVDDAVAAVSEAAA
jgi:hypothetical protein